VDLEQNVQLDMPTDPFPLSTERDSAVAAGTMEESDTTELIKMLTSTFMRTIIV